MSQPAQSSTQEVNSTQPTYAKVIIVGAGLAGLSAAYHLTKNGFTDFLILEARNRVGGRVISIPIGPEKVELGANWIHGVLGNPVYELAMQNGLVDIMAVPKPHKVVAATEQGKQLPFNILQEIYEAYLCFLQRCEEYFISQYDPPDGIYSVGEHIKLEIDLYLEKEKNTPEKHLKELLFDCLLKRETCISGCDSMNEVDLLELGSYTELQGGNITLPQGYSSILGPLLKPIPQDRILKKHAVNLIKWNCNQKCKNDTYDSDDSASTVVDAESSSRSHSKSRSRSKSRESSQEKVFSNYNVEVICDNGMKFIGDHVICAIPLGVLKAKATSLFKPPLPDYKLESIDRLLFGTVDKIILGKYCVSVVLHIEESKRPQVSSVRFTEVELLRKESDQRSISLAETQIFEKYERPFLHPSITEVLLLWENDRKSEDINKNWFKKIYSFSKISETLILGWISGKEAEYMETLPNETVMETCTMILRKFLNDPFIPKPKSCVCTSWHNQEYTKGAYTAIAVGASQIDIECLAQPLFLDEYETKPVLLFAGEHTHSNFYSTAHGAYLTGRTVAQLVVKSDKPQEILVDPQDETDLSTWIQGITLS